jgi:tetratricopeptide (TPR) repeat protein
MRPIFLPGDPETWVVAIVVLVVLFIGHVIYQWLRPPVLQKVTADPRYPQAMGVYVGHLPVDAEPSWEQRQDAFAAAVEYLTREHGLPAEEAEKGLRVLVGEYNKGLSYDLRHEALTYEQAGAYDLALDYFERAARLREGFDAEDYEFLQRCVARVRAKARRG